jgi:iron complex transport system permease protein
LRKTRKPLTAGTLLAGILILTAVLGFSILAGLSAGGGGGLGLLFSSGNADDGWHARQILLQVRLPRVLMAGLIGGALTVAGAVFQALLRNPLADPFVLGVSGGASIGGVLAVLGGLGGFGLGFGLDGRMLFSFLGALGALFLIERIATVDGRLTVYTLLLTGAIFNAFSGALIYFLQSIASLEQLHDIVFSLMGQIPSTGYASLAVHAVLIFTAVVFLFAHARDYNTMTLGEEGATQLGVDVEKIKHRTFILGSLLTGLAVSIAGLVGFVGLVIPHILRLLLGPDHRLLIPCSFLGGASFLVLADLLARVLVLPGELPVGVITALVGGPFFLYLLRKRRTGYEFV